MILYHFNSISTIIEFNIENSIFVNDSNYESLTNHRHFRFDPQAQQFFFEKKLISSHQISGEGIPGRCRGHQSWSPRNVLGDVSTKGKSIILRILLKPSYLPTLAFCWNISQYIPWRSTLMSSTSTWNSFTRNLMRGN